MEVLKIKTKSDSKGTKDKIIELFFIKRLKPVEISKKLKVGMPCGSGKKYKNCCGKQPIK